MDMDMDIQVLNQLVGLNPTMLQNHKLTEFHLPPQQSEFPATNYHFLPTTSKNEPHNSQAFTHRNAYHRNALDEDVCNNNKKKKKAVKVMERMGKNESLGKGNKSRNGETKRGEVIHVRARRGQATDSHSLAERVRRQRINSRFKCLQDIVPGCHKTMGMSVMLDEIINYVQSLQNQVEFLSMELASSASSSYVFNSNGDHAIARNVAPQHQEKYTRGADNRLKL